MGDLMRHYWLPAALCSELVPDATPIRLMLLGEKLIAFRDSAGRVGVMDHPTPLRVAVPWTQPGRRHSLYLSRWKYDVAGNCIDQPNLPPHQDFRRKVIRATLRPSMGFRGRL